MHAPCVHVGSHKRPRLSLSCGQAGTLALREDR